VTHLEGNAASWVTLKALDLPIYRSMLVIADETKLGDQMASDSHNLAVVMLLRNHAELLAADMAGIANDLEGCAPPASVHWILFRVCPLTVRWPFREMGDDGMLATLEKALEQDKGQQPIFCEILDTRTQKLVAAHPTLSKTCHFLVSNRLISKMLAMVAEEVSVSDILQQLLGGEMAMCLQPSKLYASPTESVSFFAIQKRAQRLNHVRTSPPHTQK
jgi:hypothetical protein